MKSSHRKIKKGVNIPRVVAMALGTSLLLTLILTLIGSYLVWNETIPQGSIDIWAAGVRIVAITVGCVVAMIVSDEKRAIASGITALSYIIALVCLNVLFFDGKFGNMMYAVITPTVGWGISVVIMASTRHTTGKRRKIKIH